MRIDKAARWRSNIDSLAPPTTESCFYREAHDIRLLIGQCLSSFRIDDRCFSEKGPKLPRMTRSASNRTGAMNEPGERLPFSLDIGNCVLLPADLMVF